MAQRGTLGFGVLGGGTLSTLDDVLRLPWTPPDLSDIELAALGWYRSQQALGGAVIRNTAQVVQVEWHGTSLDEHLGAFALAQTGSVMEDLVGERLRVTYRSRSIYVYVVDTSDELDYPLSLTRRAFMALTLASKDFARMRTEIVGAATG